ncbi:hypothetical protein RF11_03886 [Thelohanellus kitauei]|uniref:RNase H type-1 domain-containing protein n=1 Tax=Thelohanellus kitauei TaxID=669202 RepID=A0A0C2J5N2_THEKT|nr:hypothetical protein RF11_03886 [Thelohanellus kitauei]
MQFSIKIVCNNSTLTDGKYFVSLPWKRSTEEICDNFKMCFDRGQKLTSNLLKLPELMTEYDNTIKLQLQNDIIEEVFPVNKNQKAHYLAHRPVIRPDRNTTKLRIVFDASANRSKNHFSLNQCLFKGNLQHNNLAGILIRFRFYKYLSISDVEKAFIQIRINGDDRDFLRFLWVENIEKREITDNFKVYRFKRLPFGHICAHFLLEASILYHLKQQRDQHYPNYKSAIFTEWRSNCSELNRYFDQDCKENEIVKILGIKWNSTLDSINILDSRAIVSNIHLTKRHIAQSIGKIFDPLGLFCPFLVKLKLLLQKCWLNKNDWDKRITDEICKSWKLTIQEINGISDISINRYIGLLGAVDSPFKIICFVDASIQSYACCINAITMKENESSSCLIFAKSKLCPRENTTIPRFELLAVIIGIRSCNFILKQLNLKEEDVVIFSDSKYVLD